MLTLIIRKGASNFELFGLSALFGIAFQMINILMLYAVTSFYDGILNFYQYLTIATAFIILICSFIRSPNVSFHVDLSAVRKYVAELLRVDGFLIAIISGSIILHLFFQNFSLGPATDGASYLDYARNIFQNGSFTSRIIDPSPAVTLTFLTGLTQHVGTPFGLSLFFAISGVSYLSGKMMVIFFGVFLVIPVYLLSKELFGKKVGLLAGILVTAAPLVLEYSSMLYGPEIMMTFFLVSALYFFVSAVNKGGILKIIIAAIFAFLTFITWFPMFYLFIFMIPFLFMILDGVRSIKHSLIILGLVFFYIFFIQFSANIPVGLIFHVGIFALMIPIYLKRTAISLRLLSIFFITLNTLLEIYWIRSYYFSEVFINPSSSFSASGAVSTLLQNRVIVDAPFGLFSRFYQYLAPAYVENLSYILIVFGLLSFISFKSLRKKGILILFIIFQAIFYIVSVPNDMLSNISVLENRLLLSAVPIFAILSAVFMKEITEIIPSVEKRLHIGKKSFRVSISLICIIVIVCTLFVVQFYPISQNVEGQVKRANINVLYTGMGSAIAWINYNTSSQDIIATRKPYEWAWYTGRETVMFNQSTTLDELLTTVRECKINYVVVDPIFNDYYVNLQGLYADPNNAPLFMPLVYSVDNSDGSYVLIYNTTGIITGDFSLETVTIDTLDDSINWITAYGKLSVDKVDFQQGNSSLKLESQLSPNPLYCNQSIAKIYKDIPISNFSNSTLFNILVKSSLDLDGKVFFQIFDKSENWAVFYLTSTRLNEWQEADIPIHYSSSHSPTYPDLANIHRFVIGVFETSMPFTIQFDNLSATYIAAN
ncbi:MAG: glycosyltransferase family 39 protein [Candidatus Bathyarchaeota archaeon]|nr:glycosyltransferase family 39 protein [Candidatus Bathyarchaeota archaeon]